MIYGKPQDNGWGKYETVPSRFAGETATGEKLLLRQLVKDVAALRQEVKALRSDLEKIKEPQS